MFRETFCQYSVYGCNWRGAVGDADEHVANECEYTNILSRDALPAVQRTIEQNNHASRIKDNILNLYSMDRIGYTGLYNSLLLASYWLLRNHSLIGSYYY